MRCTQRRAEAKLSLGRFPIIPFLPSFLDLDFTVHTTSTCVARDSKALFQRYSEMANFPDEDVLDDLYDTVLRGFTDDSANSSMHSSSELGSPNGSTTSTGVATNPLSSPTICMSAYILCFPFINAANV